MAETTVPMEDDGLLSELMSDKPAEGESPPPAETESPERVRDPETGRFVAKEAQPETTEAAPTEQPVEEVSKPEPESAGVRQLREAYERAEKRAEEARYERYAAQEQLRAMQRQMAELQKPKPEPIDFFQNPEGAIGQRLQPIEERFAQLQSQLLLNSSRAMALATHGKDSVAQMESALQEAIERGDPAMGQLSAQMRASDDPVSVAMDWYTRDSLVRETGGDLKAYKEKILAEALKDNQYLAKALEAAKQVAQPSSPNSRPNIKLPPSLNKATGVGVSGDKELDDSDAATFKYAMSTARR